MCEREIERICAAAQKRWDILSYRVVHRVGALHYGDQIVFLAVASRHRTEAFRAGEFIIDSLKTRAPFWKREHLRDGEAFWVEDRKSTRLNSSHVAISYAVFCLKKKTK